MLRKSRLGWLDPTLHPKSIFGITLVIIITIITDTSYVKVSAFTGGLGSASYDLVIFTFNTTIFAVGQYLVLGFIRKMNETNEKLRIDKVLKSVSIIQAVLVGLLASLIFQMVLTSEYSVLFLESIIWISYSLATALTGFLCYRFVSWFRSNHNRVVLAYTLAIMMIPVNAIFTALYVTKELENYPSKIHPEITPLANYSGVYNIYDPGYAITSIGSFILTWVATVILLNSYSRRFGRARYWILVGIPLVYFLSQFQPILLDFFTPFRLSQPILFGVVYTLFFEATKPAGGILFGIAFWSIARNIGRAAVKEYIMISAYGMILLFSANQASTLVLVPYPPFGIVTVSYFGLASYLFLIGIYSSVMSVAQDSDLRKSIRQSAEEQTKILHQIGTSQMEDEIRKRVTTITRNVVAKSDEMNVQTGVTPSLEEEEIKEYLEQVIEEIRKSKQGSQNSPQPSAP